MTATPPPRLLRGAALSLLLRVGGAGLGFLFNLLLARLVGADGAGSVFLALSVTGLAALLARLGLDGILVREAAALAAAGRAAEVPALARTALGLIVTAALTLWALLWLAAPWLAGQVFGKPALTPALQLLSATVLPWALSLALSELLRGSQRFIESQVVQTVAASLVSLPLLLLLAGGGELQGALQALVAGQWAALLLAAVFWRRLLRRQAPAGGRSPVSPLALVRTASPLLMFTLLNTLMGTLDTLLLGIWANTADVGVYGIASRLALLTSFILLAANSYVAPHFAAFHQRGDMAGLAQLARRTARLTLAAAAPLLLLFLVFPGLLLSLIGAEFERGAPVLAVLALAQFVNVATGSVSQVLIMTRREQQLRNLALASTVAGALAMLVLIPQFGALGAALGAALGICLQNLLAMLAVYRLHRLRIDAFAGPWLPLRHPVAANHHAKP
jgi:O-antigen/teichoic acid export membrane protein